MDEILKQKVSGIAKLEFRLSDNGVWVKSKKGTQEWEYKVPYRHIGFDSASKKTSLYPYAHIANTIITAGAVVFFIYLLFHQQAGKAVNLLIIGIMVPLLAIITIKSWQQHGVVFEYITGGERTIEFLKDKPDKETYEAFRQQLLHRVKEFHKSTILSLADMDMPYEFHLPRLEWLRQIDAVTDQEIIDFKHQLLRHQKKNWN